MREANWRDRLLHEGIDCVVDLIAKHNAGIEPMNPRQTALLRARLRNMGPINVIRYVEDKYNGVLLEPDSVLVDPIELKRREMMARKVTVPKREVPKVHIPVKIVSNPRNLLLEAQTMLYGKSYVLNVFAAEEGLVVLCATAKDKGKAQRYVAREYPKLNIQFVVGGE